MKAFPENTLGVSTPAADYVQTNKNHFARRSNPKLNIPQTSELYSISLETAGTPLAFAYSQGPSAIGARTPMQVCA